MINVNAASIEAIGIIIPAHDEEALLPTCLATLRHAMARLTIPTKLIVALDACTDRSANIAGEHGLAVDFRSVGEARAAGVRAALHHFGDVPRSRIWLAMTDADSQVPGHWLEHQLALATSGAAAVAGTVMVADWDAYPESRIATYEEFYATNDHIHGANLGIRADAYEACGGFEPRRTGEDVALWNALTSHGFPVTRSRDIPVITSSRLEARAPDGFASFLRAWAA